MVVHQCAQFCNNPRLVQEHAIKRIAKFVASTSTHFYLPGLNWQLFTWGVVYRPNKEKGIYCYSDANFAGRLSQVDADNAENDIFCMGIVIMYMGCPVLWCIKLNTEIALSTTEVEYIILI